MARTALTQTTTADEGVTVAAAGTVGTVDGHMFRNSGTQFLIVKNSGASSRNLTIQTPLAPGGLAVGEQIVAVAAGAERIVGPFSTNLYNRPAGGSDAGFVYIDYAAGFEAELNVQLFSVPGV